MKQASGLRRTILCSFLIGGLLGCDTKSQSAPAPAPSSGPAKVEPKAAASQVDLSPWKQAKIDWRQFAGTNLSILGEEQPMFKALQPFLPLFEELTGMHVGFQLEEQDTMREKRTVDLSSRGGIYDVVPFGVTDLGQAYVNRWIAHLDPFLKDPSLTDAAWYDFPDFSTNSIDLCKVEGHLLSLPFDFSAPILFYRKDLFEKYRITPPDTYEELLAVKHEIQTALDAEGVKDVHAFTTRGAVGAGMNTWMVIPTIRAYGGEMFDDQWRPIFNSPEAVKALEVYRDLLTGHGSPPESRTQHFYVDRKMFQQGKLAAAVLASHFFSEISSPDKSPIWDRWDALPMPRGPAGRRTSPWSWAYGVNAGSRNPRAAWLFVQWATSKETARLVINSGSPARRSVWESEGMARKTPPGLIKAVKWIMDEGTASPMQMGLPEFPEAGLVASKAFSEIFYGAPVKQTLDRAVEQVDKIMENGPTRKRLAARAVP